MNKILLYGQFLGAFIISQFISIWGQYYTLKFPNISMIKAFFMAIPFAWIDWFFMTIAIGISHKHKLVSEIQDIFILIITQFTAVLLVNYFYLKQQLTNSDILAFVIILISFAVSYYNIISKMLNIPIPKKDSKDDKESKKSKNSKDE